MEKYKESLSAGGVILGSLIAQAGPQGKTGKDGYTPVKGIDYYTDNELQAIIQDITNAIEENLEPQEQERQTNEQKRQSNEQERTISENARIEKETDRQASELTRISNEEVRQDNENAREIKEAKREEYENHRTEAFLQMQGEVETSISNIKDMIDIYDRNATDKTNDFNNNSIIKTEAFDTNAVDKTDSFNQNAVSKTNEFNQNAADKITEFNENAQAKLNEYNANAEELTNRVSSLETDNSTNKQDISNIKEEQSTQNTIISNLQEDNKTNKTKIEEIETKNTEQDTNIQKNAEDIENIKLKDTNQDTSIEELQAKVVELETENEVLKNQLPTGEAEGENITLNDSAEMEFKELKVSGNSWQETRSGINKLDIVIADDTKGLTVTKNKDGSITLNGTVLTPGTIYISNDFTVPSNKDYTLSSKVISGTSSNKPSVVFYNSITSNWLFNASIGTAQAKQYTEDVTQKFGIYVTAGQTYENYTIAIQLIEGTYTSDTIPDYEQYGAMPSSEFPSEIKNVTGSANITVCNENLFDKSTVTNNKYVDASNGRFYNFDGVSVSDYILVKPNDNIIMSGDDVLRGNGYAIFDANKVFLEGHGTERLKNGIVLPSNARYLVVNATTAILDIFKIEVNTIATPYKPHQSQVINFPLSEGQRLYKGSYLADDGIHHKRGQVVLDGTEDWTTLDIQNTDNTFYLASTVIDNTISKTNNDICCNIAVKGNVWGSDTPNVIQNVMLYSALRMRMAKILINSVEDWKSYLVEQYANGTPVTVEYGLAEEVIEPYTEEQQIIYNQIKKATSYKNVTHIFSTDEISPVFDVTYRKDLETYIDNKINAITNAVIELGGTVNV